MKRPLALFALVASTACVVRTGWEAREDPRARPHRGASIRLEGRDDHSLDGELLAVDSSAYTVLTGDRVTVIPVASWLHGMVSYPDDRRNVWLYLRGVPGPANMIEARSHARFPAGIPDPVWAALLERTKQTRPDTVRLSGP